MKKKLFIMLMSLFMVTGLYAYDFTATCSSGQTLAYTIVDAGAKTVEVAQPDAMPEGNVNIDATVVNPDDSETYTVIGIGTRAFQNATKLTGVTFPTAATFTYIGKYDAYQYCFDNSGLTGKLVIPDNVTQITSRAFGDTKISELQIGNGVTKIGGSAFYNCKNLKHVVLPDAVEFIGSTCFGACSNLAFLQLGTGMQTVTTDAFNYSYKLDTLVIKATTPPAVGNYIEDAIVNYTVLYVPSASLAAYKAHPGWGRFKFIVAEGTVLNLCTLTYQTFTSSYINDDCIIELDGSEITKNTSAKFEKGKSVNIVLKPQLYWKVDSVKLNGTDIKDQFVNNEADILVTEDATLKVTWDIDNAYDFTETVPSGQILCFRIIDAVNKKVKIVNQSGGRAISGHTSYGYVQKSTNSWNYGEWVEGNPIEPTGDLIIPAEIKHEGTTYTITEIDTLAFSSSEITSIAIQEGIKKIRDGAFYQCSSLGGYIFIPQSCDSLGIWAFRSCGAIKNFSFGGVKRVAEYALLYNNYITHLQVPASVTQIGASAFSDMYKLESIEIGENVTLVANSAFRYSSNLKTVIVYATTPPLIKERPEQDYENDYWYGYYNAPSSTLYVPKGSKSAYEAANCWKLFGTIEELPDLYTISTAVKDVNTGNVLGGGKYEKNLDINLTAVPALHYTFKQWTDGNTDNPRNVTVTADATYTAEFVPQPTQVGDILETKDHGQIIRFKVTSVAPNEVKLISNGNYYRNIASDWTIPASVEDYWGETFKLTCLGQYCMYNTNGIDTLRIPEGVRVVESSALYNSSCFKKWYFPSTIDSIYGNNATYCYNLQDIRFAGTDNLRYADFSTFATGSTSAPILSATPANSFCIKDGLALFYKGTAPQVLDIPEGVKVIGEYAFSPYALNYVKSVRLPSTLKVMNVGFSYLPSLGCKAIYLKATTPPVLDEYTFSYMNNKRLILDCGIDLDAYRAHPIWNKFDTIVNGSQFIPTVNLASSNGTYEIKEPECGTIRIVAKPNTYYVVDEWSTGAKELDSIDVVLTSDSTISLSFKYESYTVRFLNWDGTEAYPSIKVQRGNNIGTVPQLPERTGYTAQYWTRSDNLSETAAVFSNVDFTAYYTPKTYTITFNNWNGDLLQQYSRKYDETIYYTAATPVKLANDTFTYAFNSWEPEVQIGVTTVTGDQTFTATFTPTYKEYTITFKNYDGTQLDKQTLHFGDVITYAGEVPTKPSTEQYVYDFTGFDGDFEDGVTKVSGNIEYFAGFEQKTRKYTITFVDEDGTTPVWSGEFEYGTMPVYGGETPNKPADNTYSYTFKEWTPALAYVYSEATYQAVYSQEYINYTVQFVDYNDAVLATQENKHYGDVITYTEVPEREADVQYVYTFDKWEPDFESGVTTVSGNMTFKATYATKLQKYTVTFLENEGGAQLDQAIVSYGSDATPVAPDITAITPDDKRFGGWSQDITNVQGNMTVWPLWKDKIYTVQFMDPLNNNEVIDEYDNVPFGGKVAPPVAPQHDGYNFTGWDSDAYLNVTDDLVIKALYTAITGLDNIELDKQAEKFIRNGQLYILRNGQLYNANGAKVK